MYTTIGLKKVYVDKPSLLQEKYGIFTVEFDNSLKLYVGHVCDKTIITGLRNFINNALDDSINNYKVLKADIREAEMLYVSIKATQIQNTEKLFKLKYDLIKSNYCYAPYGYNTLSLKGRRYSQERLYKERLLADIKNGLLLPIKQPKKASCKRITPNPDIAKQSKAIIEYKKDANGMWTEAYEWPSLTKAAEHYGISKSAISSCCNGRVYSTHGSIWRFKE